MSLRGPFFLRGADGSGGIRSRRDQIEDQILISLGNRTAVKYSLEGTTVVTHYFVPSYLNLSAPLAWDPITKQYCCVLNDIKLLAWDGVENHLEKVSCHALADRAIDILTTADDCFIVFVNGSIQNVSYLTQKRKMTIEENVLPQNADIKQSKLFYRDSILYLNYRYGLEPEMDVAVSFRVTVDPETQETRLFKINEFRFPATSKATQIGETSAVFYISNDGHLCSVDLSAKSSLNVRTLARLFQQSMSRPIHLCIIDDVHVAALGDDAKADGSVISIINIIHNIVIVNQSIKAVLSNSESCGLLLAFEGSRRVLFKHGQRVANLIIEELPGNLAALVGSQTNEKFADIFSSDQNEDDNLPLWEVVGSVSQPVQLYKILPDLLVEQNTDRVAEVIETFTDIPELLVLNIIEMLFAAPDEKFSAKNSKFDLLSRAFLLPVNDSLMIQHLRSVDFFAAKNFLSTLFEIIQSANEDSDSFEKVISWIGIILNAHYTNFVLSKDDDTHHQLLAAFEIVNQLEESLHLICTTLPLIKMIAKNQSVRPAMSQKIYNIEIVDL